MEIGCEFFDEKFVLGTPLSTCNIFLLSFEIVNDKKEAINNAVNLLKNGIAKDVRIFKLEEVGSVTRDSTGLITVSSSPEE